MVGLEKEAKDLLTELGIRKTKTNVESVEKKEEDGKEIEHL